MSKAKYCDGISRRDLLKAGSLATLGLSLSDYLRLAEAGEVKAAPAQAAIVIWLGGGPPHLDTFDMKPEAPAEIRGEFNPIATSTPGINICEHLPRLAKCTDKYAILNGVSHTLAGHELGTSFLSTGNRPIPSLTYPGYGAVVNQELAGAKELPHFVAIPNTPQTAGYLGVRNAPLATNSTPQAGAPFNVRGISLTGGLTVEQFERRQRLRERVDTAFQELEASNKLIEGLDRFDQQAYAVISSAKAREAFDTSLEQPAVAERFGTDKFGMSCLLATRLVTAGVRFVTVSFGGWDTHTNNFRSAQEKLLPPLDQGLSALLTTLDERGLLASTAIMVTGEFGRTPKINARAGRDHWPRAFSVLMAGGGMRGGQILGASDDQGAGPKGEPITPEQVAASFYHALGIDCHKEYATNTGRPVMIVRAGTVLKGLFG